MLALYNQLYPKKNISVQQLISLLKPKVSWDLEKRCPKTSIKGCFIKVVEKFQDDTIHEQFENELNPLDHGLDITPEPKINNEELNKIKSENDKLTSENERLIKEIEKLKKITSKIKLADGKVYNYESDDDEKMESNELNELMTIINDIPEIITEPVVKKVKKNKVIIQ